jgi:hypothetical protein
MGGLNLLNSPLPPREWLERGSKESITRKSPIGGMSLVPHPHAGERGQGRVVPSHFLIPTSADMQEKESANR